MIVALGRENEEMLKTLVDLGFGQLVSFDLAIMTFSASLVSTQEINKQCGAVNKAFQFTSITSVTIQDCWTIVWSIILTWMFLATRFVLYFLFCTLMPFVLKRSGAAFFNLSMLTSDMWAVVIRIFIYKQKVVDFRDEYDDDNLLCREKDPEYHLIDDEIPKYSI
ncbi:hypothetical protein SASPL_102167 [Salvia splendens]|uniref:Uncharacterized protein n=1 Tax=Salvia splendens TaxID=180675 RepID=A0A8X8YW79_SALSN|nr:hypothetical protein SASPL_102167 [Salvia splendens]